jgi:hypothetical protein
MFSRLLIIVGFSFVLLCGQRENRIFWDGSDWNRIAIQMNQESESIYRVKAAHINGLLDGRLYYYLKAWEVEPVLAEDAYDDPLDLLRHKELIKALDNFYSDPKHNTIPVISAIIIANMRIGGISEPVVYRYIEETRFWANSMKADIDSISVEILAAKLDKHLSKPFDISEKYGRGPDYERKRVVLKPKYPQAADKGDKEMAWYMRLLQGWKFGITGGTNRWSASDSAVASGSGYNIVMKTPLHFTTEKLETRVRLETGSIKFSTDLKGSQTAAYVQFGLRDSKIPLINRMMLDIGVGSTLGNISFSSGLLITLRKKRLDLITRYVSASSTPDAQLPPNWISISLGFNF